MPPGRVRARPLANVDGERKRMTTSQEPTAHDAGSQISHGPITKTVVAVVMTCARQRWPVLIITAILCAVSLWYLVGRFTDPNDSAINTNTDDFIAASVPWRKDEIAYAKAFPNQDNDTIVVVDGKTPELADQAVTALFAKLQNHPALFHSVVRPDGGPFFAKNGLLFQSTEEVQKAVGGLMKARSVLGIIASDPSLRGVFDAFGFIPKGVEQKQGSFDQFKAPIESMNGALENVLAGQAGLLLLAEPARQRRRAEWAPVAQVHRDRTSPRLRRHPARRQGERLHPRPGARPAPRRGTRRRRAHNRPGADRRRGIRHRARRLRDQRACS